MRKIEAKRYGFAAAVLLVAMGLQSAAVAQLLHPASGAAPSFEVAMVKQSRAEETFSFHLTAVRFVAQNAPLDRLIRFAFDVKSDTQIANMPKWAGSACFDIDAKISDDDVEAMKRLPPDQRFQQYRLMVQALLVNRFQLRVRTEMKERPVYALVVAKGNPRLTPSMTQPDPQNAPLPRLAFTARGELTAKFVSMAFFADWLSGKPDTGNRVVSDETGLKGNYDFVLEWSPVENSSAADQPTANQPAGGVTAGGDKPSLFAAVQEQLGLKLESRNASVEVMVIDHLEPPTAN
ncbi:MAG TPA: TIGR03435 family protein [Terracidiphilus sp.]